jgi:hypothetical protein
MSCVGYTRRRGVIAAARDGSVLQITDFKALLKAGRPLVGSFIKTPSPHVVEVLGDAGADFLVVDREHAPIDKGAVDLAVTAKGDGYIYRIFSTQAEDLANLSANAQTRTISSAYGAHGVLI